MDSGGGADKREVQRGRRMNVNVQQQGEPLEILRDLM